MIALAAIPGFGTFAYVASKPIRSNRLLVRVMLDAAMAKVPWNLYQRSGMRRIVARTATSGRPVFAPVINARDEAPMRNAYPMAVPVPVTVDPHGRAAA